MADIEYKSYLIDKIKATVSTNPDTAKRVRKKCLYQEDYSKKINESGQFKKKPDFAIFTDKDQNDIFVISEFRGVCITCKDLAFMALKSDKEKADEDWEYLLDLMMKADELFKGTEYEGADKKRALTADVFKDLEKKINAAKKTRTVSSDSNLKVDALF